MATNPRRLSHSFQGQPPKIKGISSADWSIDQLPGLSPEDQAKLAACGIHTTLELLKQGKTLQSRTHLSSQLQIHIKHVNKWVALADLARIPTVGCRYCGLLLHAGIASPEHLGQMPLDRLHRQILRLQVSNLQRRDLCPTFAEVEQWSQQSRLVG
ncbi:MAG: DUF4332 domain-containing protein [Leptolyngbyaceae cyanobacterium CSU_1_3]|nr:DUF4332 domain-containing protein [Leptolyngbyaceae cyanobacterium CSU_1_3]